jgi:hypothetical protein
MHGLMLLPGRSSPARIGLVHLATIVASLSCVVGTGGGTSEPTAMRQNDRSLLLRRMKGNSAGGMSQEGGKWREEGMLPLRPDGGSPRRFPNPDRGRNRLECCPHPTLMLRLRGGGRPVEGGKQAGVMDRVWASLKSILSVRGRGSPSGIVGVGGGDGGGGASSKTNKGQDGTKKQWDWREAGEQARKNKIAKEEEKVKNEIELMMSRHPEFSNKASSFIEGPLESRNEEFERSVRRRFAGRAWRLATTL